MKLRKLWLSGTVTLLCLTAAGTADAQLRDVTQTPNAINAGIRKSFDAQKGFRQGERGTVFQAGSSAYIIARDPARAIRRGRQIFQRKFTSRRASARPPATASATWHSTPASAPVSSTPAPAATAARAARPASAATSSRVRTAATRPTCSASACRRSWATR